MNKHNRKISRPIRIGLSFIIAVALIIVFVPLLNNVIHPIKYIASSENTLTVSIPYIINGEVDETTLEIPRGTQVHISEKGAETSQIKYKGQLVSIPNENLVDSLEKLVMPFRVLIVNKLYEEAQDLLYKVLTSKIEYAFANENDDDKYEEYDWEDREIYDNDTIPYSDVGYQLLSYYFYLNKKLNKSSNDERSKKLLNDYPGAKIKDLLSYPDLKYLD